MLDAEAVARKVEIHLSHNNYDAARSVIDVAEREAEHAARQSMRPMTIDEKLEMPLAEAGLSVRLVNKLDRNEIFTVRDLLNTPKERLLSIRHLGESAMQQILDRLGELGFNGRETV